jgi:hypothetical protein
VCPILTHLFAELLKLLLGLNPLLGGQAAGEAYPKIANLDREIEKLSTSYTLLKVSL